MSVFATLDSPAQLDALKWRCIGPSRGGRVVAVAGDPVDRMTFYFGACAGGIWKTTDGGTAWQDITGGIPYVKPLVLRFNPATSELWAGGVGLYKIKQ